ncbi:MAG: helix-turn-helix transcriptional regulator [Firmicutes bacterium]|nr:helix-turn-helix transcriptional regulator [Bacillota bacterium]
MELCKRTKIRPATINGMYHGKTKRVNVVNLDKICRALDCTTEDILEYIPDEEYEEFFKGRI